jgi:hypothetical protein
MWWYIAVFLGSFAMAMATVYTGHSGLPWWVTRSFRNYFIHISVIAKVGFDRIYHYRFHFPSFRGDGLRCHWYVHL